MKGKLIEIFSDDDGPPWTGDITFPRSSGEPVKIDVARRNPPLDSVNDEYLPFRPELVDALLDLQIPCALGVTHIDHFDRFGGIGEPYICLRQRVKAAGNSVVVGAFASEIDTPDVVAISATSPAISTILGNPQKAPFDGKMNPITVRSITLDGGSPAELRLKPKTSFSTHSESREYVPELTLGFPRPVTARTILDFAHLLPPFLNLLTGQSFSPPKVSFTCSGPPEGPNNRRIVLGGHDWHHESFSLSCLYDLTADEFLNILPRLQDLSKESVHRMHVLNSTICKEMFAEDMMYWTLPHLERLLRSRFRNTDEESFLKTEKQFFDWVASADDPNIEMFSKKHLVVKSRKAPGFKQLLERCTSYLKNFGVHLPADSSNLLNTGRQMLMHGEIGPEYDEFPRVCDISRGLLLLLTLMELGINPQGAWKGIKLISREIKIDRPNW